MSRTRAESGGQPANPPVCSWVACGCRPEPRGGPHDRAANQAAGIDVVCADESSGGVRLSMSVNDKQILETTVTDHPLKEGLAGLQAWTHPAHDEMDILWHNFTISPVS